MNDEIDSVSAQRAEVVQQLRMLAMGRLGAANRLAELLVPDRAPELQLPVVEQAEPAAEAAQRKTRSKKAT